LHKHTSNIVKCLDVISKSDKQWSLIKEKYVEFMIVAKPSYQKMAPLVKYFEAAAINVPLNQGGPQARRCITADYLNLVSMNEKLADIITQVEGINKDGLIDLIDAINS
jgi:hypothetical protein